MLSLESADIEGFDVFLLFHTGQYACENLVDRARGYGIQGYVVDGTDLRACLETFTEAVAAARATGKPQMVVGKLLRLAGHGEHDDASYVDPALKEEPSGRDPIDVATAYFDEMEVRKWQEEALKQVAEAIAKAQNEAGPDAGHETWLALASEHLVEGRRL